MQLDRLNFRPEGDEIPVGRAAACTCLCPHTAPWVILRNPSRDETGAQQEVPLASREVGVHKSPSLACSPLSIQFATDAPQHLPHTCSMPNLLTLAAQNATLHGCSEGHGLIRVDALAGLLALKVLLQQLLHLRGHAGHERTSQHCWGGQPSRCSGPAGPAQWCSTDVCILLGASCLLGVRRCLLDASRLLVSALNWRACFTQAISTFSFRLPNPTLDSCRKVSQHSCPLPRALSQWSRRRAGCQ